VALDPTATVAPDAVELLLGTLDRTAGRAKPDGTKRRIHVVTSSPRALHPRDGGLGQARDFPSRTTTRPSWSSLARPSSGSSTGASTRPIRLPSRRGAWTSTNCAPSSLASEHCRKENHAVPEASQPPHAHSERRLYLHAGLEKWHGDEERAKAIHGMAAGAYRCSRTWCRRGSCAFLRPPRSQSARPCSFRSSRTGAQGRPSPGFPGPRVHVHAHPVLHSWEATGRLLPALASAKISGCSGSALASWLTLGALSCARDAAAVGP